MAEHNEKILPLAKSIKSTLKNIINDKLCCRISNIPTADRLSASLERIRESVILEIVPIFKKLLCSGEISKEDSEELLQNLLESETTRDDKFEWEKVGEGIDHKSGKGISKRKSADEPSETESTYNFTFEEDDEDVVQIIAFNTSANGNLNSRSQIDIRTSTTHLAKQISNVKEKRLLQPELVSSSKRGTIVSTTNKKSNFIDSFETVQCMKYLISAMLDRQFIKIKKDKLGQHALFSEDKVTKPELKLDCELMDCEKLFLRRHFDDLLAGASIELNNDAPSDPIVYLGHYILKRRYLELFSDLSNDDIKHLVALREQRTKELMKEHTGNDTYLCILLNDKKLFKNYSHKYKFEVLNKVTVIRGRRLQPKIKKICGILVERSPLYILSKKLRKQNVYKDLKEELSMFLGILRSEVGMVKETEIATIYEDIMQQLSVVLPELPEMKHIAHGIKRFDKCESKSGLFKKSLVDIKTRPQSSRRSLNTVEQRQSMGIFRQRTASFSDNLSNRQMLNNRTTLPVLSKSLPAIDTQLGLNEFSSNNSLKLPSVNQEISINLLKINHISRERACKIHTKIEEIIGNKVYAVQSMRKLEIKFIQSEIRQLLERLLDQQYTVNEKYDDKNIVEAEVMPLLETVLLFENERDKRAVGDNIITYLRQIILNQNSVLRDAKKDELDIVRSDVKKILKTFTTNSKIISTCSAERRCTCPKKSADAQLKIEEEFSKYLQIGHQQEVIDLFRSISQKLEELNVDKVCLHELERASKAIIKAGTENKQYITSGTLKDVEQMRKLSNRIFRTISSRPSANQRPEDQNFTRCGWCILLRICCEIGRILERADRMFELRRLQEKEELQTEIGQMFASFVEDPGSPNRNQRGNIVIDDSDDDVDSDIEYRE